MKKLIIAEKDNTAKRIAEILSEGDFEKETKNKLSVYSFNGSQDQVKVMGLRGHIMKLDFIEKYSDWQETNPDDLIDAEIKKDPLYKNIYDRIKEESKDSDKVIIATDYDREGELIGKDAYDIVNEVNGSDIRRARFSALTKDEIDEAFDNLGTLDFNLSDSGEARQIIDLIWGASLTRFISLNSMRFGNNFLSVGRVQTPTLAIIVDKEKEIEQFDPTPYWEIYAKFDEENEFEAKHIEDRFWDKEKAEKAIDQVTKKATVKESETKKKYESPPIPFNTTQFLRASSSIGLSPSASMSIAETLYTEGYISYPRTDNTVYPDSLDFNEKLDMLSSVSELNDLANSLLGKEKYSPTKGDKFSTDHPPIHPTSPVKKDKLSKKEWKVYELIARRFMATLADKAVKRKIKLKIESNGEVFKTTGKKYIKLGWRRYYPYYKKKERELPALEEGKTIKVIEKDLHEKETKPPRRIGTNRLISKMEDLNLGTKATRHNILSKLYSRNYIHGDPPKPTKTAETVIETLEEYAEHITKPKMTAELEEEMEKIKEGKVNKDLVVDDSRKMLKKVFKELKENKDLISESMRKGLREDKIIGKCPECGEDLIIRRSKKGSRFVGCTGYPDCEFSLPLPKKGTLIKTKQICEDHGLNKLKVSKNNSSPWFLGCPQCNYEEWKKSEATST
ncbi:MAG: Topoisomerase IA TopA [Candidatus Methanohalarchaeum thermophilum]|uniref:DNA topoisomerase 1 n=1 Tax=Methanohalarchaeum thermophilum TaxID=1903181 RepID=A0A1Q6DWB7_METT1|nr:MAG: Topoisomerase IA TopA [Candidatus Methanohalarchaeum thermophilum]